MPYFAKLSLEELSDQKIEGYWTWRLNYWSSKEGQERIANAQKSRTTQKRPYKQKLGNVAKKPAQKTLQMEQAALKQVLDWARKHGLIASLPNIKAPKLQKHHQISRRPAFDLDEWRALYRYLRIWVKEEFDPKDPKGARPNSLHKWHRQLTRLCILFMGCSGLRPNEARQLRWRDIEVFTDSEDREHVLLHIAPSTKTGARECIPLQIVKRYLVEVRTLSLHTDRADLVFCNRDSDPVQNFGKTFKKVLKESDLLENRFGQVRTIYSLRHTYATFKILYGKTAFEDLTLNMGCSPMQIYNHYSHLTVRDKATDLSGKRNEEMSRKGLFF